MTDSLTKEKSFSADLEKARAAVLMRRGLAIVRRERRHLYESHAEGDGVVRDSGALSDLRRYDRFIKDAAAWLKRNPT